MTKKEKFQQLMEQLENVGNELNALLEDHFETHSDIEHSLFMLQSAHSDIEEIGISLFEE